jgi:hypothetical protein
MNNIKFVTAQPDVSYFHWQCEIYVNNFIEKGIDPNQIHIVFSTTNNAPPSPESLGLKKYGVNIHHYKDDREDKSYIPSIKPYLISKWLKDNPEFGKTFFLHDADIIFRELPDFDSLLSDDISYLSDTIGYIGYNYIIDCCRRYEGKHPSSKENQLIQEMVDIVGVSLDVVKENQENSGGGQYLIKNTDHLLWEKIYNDSTPLYKQMLDYQKRFPIHPGEIQFWTAEMWSVLWNLWLFGVKTKITKELDFSWATDSVKIYDKKPILHMAGVTDSLKTKKFYKGEYILKNPINELRKNPKQFDYVENDSSTIKYVEIMKRIVEKTQ